MKIERRALKMELTTAEGKRMGEGRSTGIHLSDVLNKMEESLGGGGWKDKGLAGGQNYMTMGFLWELSFSEALERYFGMQRQLRVAQGESCLDGIYMTPDAVNVTDGYLEEYKVTWRSMAKLDQFELHFWKWIVQLKANCLSQGTTKARMIIFFVNGNYTKGTPEGQPQMVMLEFEFSQEELEQNWNMVKSVAKTLKPGEVAKPQVQDQGQEKDHDRGGRESVPGVRSRAGVGRGAHHRRV